MENKTSKYFKYAIGEIILVVIGILIALQINNWNENNKLIQQETTYYCKIIEDLNADISNIEQTFSSIENRQATTRNLLINLLKIQEDKSVLLNDYLSTIRSLVFIPTKAAIEDITSSGKLENLRNVELKNAILNFYVKQDYYMGILKLNDSQLSKEVFNYPDFTDFGIQELPLYQNIYGEELKKLLKSTHWHKDPNSALFRHLRNHMNMTLVVCERKQDILNTLKQSTINLKNLLTSSCNKL
jgi:hypothetical protein